MSARSKNKRNSTQGGRSPEAMSDVVDKAGDLKIYLENQLREWTDGPQNIGTVLGMVTAIWPTSLAYQPPRTLISIYDLTGIMINSLNEGRKKGKVKTDDYYLEAMKEFCCLEDLMAITRAEYTSQNNDGINLLDAIATRSPLDEETSEEEDENEDAFATLVRDYLGTDEKVNDGKSRDEQGVAELTPTKELEAKSERDKVVELLQAPHYTLLSKKCVGSQRPISPHAAHRARPACESAG